MSWHCRRQGVSGERFCFVEMEHSNNESPTANPSPQVAAVQTVVTEISETEGQTECFRPDNSVTAPALRSIPSDFGSKLQVGKHRRETVSSFKSRRWSFSSKRPTSQSSFKGKLPLQRRNSIESKVQEHPNPQALQCKRFHIRRGALSNPELMAMPQNIREKVQKDVEVRQKSLKRKISNFLTMRLDLDKEVDLF